MSIIPELGRLSMEDHVPGQRGLLRNPKTQKPTSKKEIVVMVQVAVMVLA
jgi:hypothetical protein